MKSKIQIVMVMIMAATLAASGISTNATGHHRSNTGQSPIVKHLPVDPPQGIGPTCLPSGLGCAK